MRDIRSNSQAYTCEAYIEFVGPEALNGSKTRVRFHLMFDLIAMYTLTPLFRFLSIALPLSLSGGLCIRTPDMVGWLGRRICPDRHTTYA